MKPRETTKSPPSPDESQRRRADQTAAVPLRLEGFAFRMANESSPLCASTSTVRPVEIAASARYRGPAVSTYLKASACAELLSAVTLPGEFRNPLRLRRTNPQLSAPEVFLLLPFIALINIKARQSLGIRDGGHCLPSAVPLLLTRPDPEGWRRPLKTLYRGLAVSMYAWER